MVRGLFLGTLGAIVGATFGLAWPHPGMAILLPWIVILNWWWVFLLLGPFLVLAGVPLDTVQQIARRHLPPRLFIPVAILLGAPFGVAVFFLVLKFFGKAGNPWTDLTWLPWMPGAVGAGLGLGWGRLRGPTTDE